MFIFFFHFPCPTICIRKKLLLREMSVILLPRFPSMIFMVLSLTFKSLIHSESILIRGVTTQSLFSYVECNQSSTFDG